jgi:hypothetical protein
MPFTHCYVLGELFAVPYMRSADQQHVPLNTSGSKFDPRSHSTSLQENKACKERSAAAKQATYYHVQHALAQAAAASCPWLCSNSSSEKKQQLLAETENSSSRRASK